jgi:hypothetical protein
VSEAQEGFAVMATMAFEYYNSMVKAGFTEEQGFELMYRWMRDIQQSTMEQQARLLETLLLKGIDPNAAG